MITATIVVKRLGIAPHVLNTIVEQFLQYKSIYLGRRMQKKRGVRWGQMGIVECCRAECAAPNSLDNILFCSPCKPHGSIIRYIVRATDGG